MKKMKQRLLAGLCSFALIASSIGIEAFAGKCSTEEGYFRLDIQDGKCEMNGRTADSFANSIAALAGIGAYEDLTPVIGGEIDKKNKSTAYFDLDNKGGYDIAVDLKTSGTPEKGIIVGKDKIQPSPAPSGTTICKLKVLDTCSIKGVFDLELGEEQIKAIESSKEFCYRKLRFVFLDDYNFGTYSTDLSNGSYVIKLNELGKKENEALEDLIVSMLNSKVLPEGTEPVIYTDYEGKPNNASDVIVINCDVDKDGTYDMKYIQEYNPKTYDLIVTFAKLYTCSVEGTAELKLPQAMIDLFEENYKYYYDTWKIKFSEPAPEPSPSPEPAPAQQETAAEIAPAAQVEAAPTEAVISNVTYKVDGESAVLASAPKAKGNFKVPATVKIGDKDLPVNKIAAGAFKGSKITKLTIGNNVTEIGASAAEGCKKLTTVTIGTGLEKIGTKAFFKCGKLKTVTIKSSKVKNVGNKAFKKIKNKATIKVPKKKVSAYKRLFKKAKDSSTTIKKK